MERKYLSVHALNKYIKAVLDNDYQLQNLFIEGEISNYRPHASGHMYFTLKDKYASINAIMFSSYAKKVPFKVTNGLKVQVRCHVSVYEKTGTYQIYIEDMREAGIGDLAYRFEILKKRLEKEGLFDQNHKKKIPSFPSRIAVLSAKQGAALQDVLRTIKLRFPFVNIIVFPIPVQGVEAYKKIIDTLNFVDKLHCSTIILARGGGSLEDLWNFNEEDLVKCIYKLETPLISGIGHETDFTLTDFVSDYRAATPTAAAVYATPDQKELKKHLYTTYNKLNNLVKTYIKNKKTLLTQSENYYIFKNPGYLYENEFIRLAAFKDKLSKHARLTINDCHNELFSKNGRMGNAMKNRIQQESVKKNVNEDRLTHYFQNNLMKVKMSFQMCVEKLDLVSPLKILSKGYSVVKSEEKIIKSKNDIHKDDIVDIHFYDGTKKAKIQ